MSKRTSDTGGGVVDGLVCTCCGGTRAVREFRIQHSYHKDMRQAADSWSTHCRACRRRERDRNAKRVVAENTRLKSTLEQYAVDKEARAQARAEIELQAARLKFARSQYLKAVRIDKQQILRMSKNQNPTRKTAHAMGVRLDKIDKMYAQYVQQVEDIKAGKKPKPLDIGA